MRLTDLEYPEHEEMWLLYRTPRMPRCTTHILIGLAYHPPNGDNYACSIYIIETLDSVLKRHPSAETILLSDFNKLYDRSLISFPLRQLFKAPTRGLSILHKIYSNKHNYYHKSSFLLCVGRSDHDAVSFVPIGNRHSTLVTVITHLPETTVLLAEHIWPTIWLLIIGLPYTTYHPATKWSIPFMTSHFPFLMSFYLQK